MIDRTVTEVADELRLTVKRMIASRQAWDNPKVARENLARFIHNIRYCQARTDPAEPWDAEAWRPVVAAELARRRCAGCDRLRGRAAIAGGYCATCQADRARGCGGCGSPLPASGVCPVCATRICPDCGGKLHPYHGPGRYCTCGIYP